MKLLSLKGRNIGLLKGDFEFNFDDALTVITGPIGCGKSTVLTMIRASLTNLFPGNAASWASWGTPPQEACYFVATWRIGDKTLHIAKCVSGDKQFSTLNIPRLRIEHDSGQIEDISSSREALERTLSLIPVPSSIIDGHLIVDQDSITAPVASTAAKFKEIIHTLTRTNDLENMRGLIRDVMMSVVVPDVEEPLKQAKYDFEIDSGEVSKYEKMISELVESAVDLQIDDVNRQLDNLQKVKAGAERRDTLKKELETSAGIMRQLDTSAANLASSKAKTENSMKAMENAVEESKKVLYSADAIIRANNRISALRKLEEEQLAKLEAHRINQVHPPEFELPTDDHIDELSEAIVSVNQEISSVVKKLDLAEKGQCPECGNSTSVCETDMENLVSQLNKCKELKSTFENALVTFKTQRKAWQEFTIKAQQWLDVAESSNARYEEICAELESLKDTPSMDDASKARHMKVVAEYDSLVKALARLDNDISAMNAHKANQAAVAEKKQAELDGIPDEAFDAYLHARLMKIVDDHLQLRMKISSAKGSLENAKASLERSKSRLEAQEKRAALVKPIQTFRSVLDKASSVLVKDGLPKLLSLQYMGKLNERLAFYLNTINADFSAYIDDNLEFMARKSDGLVHAAKRLSGGQKQQASVAYLLAVNDVFASTLGILALDEPSGAMQESNSQDLAEAFSYLAKVGKQTGRQFIVITHSASLAAYGCTHIALEGEYAR